MMDAKQRASGERDDRVWVLARQKQSYTFCYVDSAIGPINENFEIVRGSQMLHNAWHYICENEACSSKGWSLALNILAALEELTIYLERL